MLRSSLVFALLFALLFAPLSDAFPLSFKARSIEKAGYPQLRKSSSSTSFELLSYSADLTLDESSGTLSGSIECTYRLDHETDAALIKESITLEAKKEETLPSHYLGEFTACSSMDWDQASKGAFSSSIASEKGPIEALLRKGQDGTYLYLTYTWKDGEIGSLGRIKAKEESGEENELRITKTFLFEQITSFPKDTRLNGDIVFGKKGDLALFSLRGAPTKIFQINKSGSGLKKLDAYESSIVPKLALSPGCAFALSSDNYSIRLYDLKNDQTETLVSFKQPSIVSVCASNEHVYFLLRVDTPFASALRKQKRGLYSIDLKTKKLSHLVGPSKIVEALGFTEKDERLALDFGETSSSLAVSDSGEALVFSVRCKGEGLHPEGRWLFSFKEGSIEPLYGPLKSISSLGISGNGKRLGYIAVPLDGPIYGAVMNLDGSNHTMIVEHPPMRFVDGNTRNEPVQFTYEGDKLIFGTSAILFDLCEQTCFQLGTRGGRRSKFQDELFRLKMSETGDTFLFIMRGYKNRRELATLTLNPKEKTDAPSIEEPKITPLSLPRGKTSFATITAKIDSKDLLTTCCASILKEGIYDRHVHCGLVMYDDGLHRGDQAKNDGIYTHNGINAYQSATTGKREVRIKAESRAQNNKYKAYVIEFEPFSIR